MNKVVLKLLQGTVVHSQLYKLC